MSNTELTASSQTVLPTRRK